MDIGTGGYCPGGFCPGGILSGGILSSIRHMYMADFAYDGPIFLVPLSLSYLSSPVYINTCI